jgi:hypothetical protein
MKELSVYNKGSKTYATGGVGRIFKAAHPAPEVNLLFKEALSFFL